SLRRVRWDVRGLRVVRTLDRSISPRNVSALESLGTGVIPLPPDERSTAGKGPLTPALTKETRSIRVCFESQTGGSHGRVQPDERRLTEPSQVLHFGQRGRHTHPDTLEDGGHRAG